MKTFRKLSILFAALLTIVALTALTGCNKVDKPELKGEGELALSLPEGILSPEYHQPVEYWKQHHMDLINSGDYSKQECMLCHNAHTSCNNCHDFVGVERVSSYE
jgi:hypothetical protein